MARFDLSSLICVCGLGRLGNRGSLGCLECLGCLGCLVCLECPCDISASTAVCPRPPSRSGCPSPATPHDAPRRSARYSCPRPTRYRRSRPTRYTCPRPTRDTRSYEEPQYDGLRHGHFSSFFLEQAGTGRTVLTVRYVLYIRCVKIVVVRAFERTRTVIDGWRTYRYVCTSYGKYDQHPEPSLPCSHSRETLPGRAVTCAWMAALEPDGSSGST